MLYASRPQIATSASGKAMVVKGFDSVSVVLGEVVGYEVARLVNLPTPRWSLCEWNSRVLFGSDYLTAEEPDRWVGRGTVSDAAEMFGRMVVVDVLIGNNDRNVGSVLAIPDDADARMCQVVFIDFERAEVARLDSPLFTMSEARRFLPTGALRSLLARSGPAILRAAAACVTRLPDVAGCGHVVRFACRHLGLPDRRADSILACLESRSKRLAALIAEAGAL